MDLTETEDIKKRWQEARGQEETAAAQGAPGSHSGRVSLRGVLLTTALVVINTLFNT